LPFSSAARLRGLPADENGNVIVYVSVTAAVLLGMVGLALDGGRAMITHSEAQAAADAAALAGASQLDQQTGACSRAQTEAAVVANQQRFAQGGGGPITIASGGAVCLNGLPSGDSASTSSYVTTDDASSQYVQVTTQQLTHQNTLLNAAASNNTTATVQRTAIAGFRRSLCSSAPVMMVCDTYSWTAGAAYDAWIAAAQNKGWLSSCGNSAGCVSGTLAATQASFCVVDNSVQPVPGNKTTQAANGYDTRFGQGSTTTYPSDLDIISYPHDLVNGTPGWDCATYWGANHAGVSAPTGCTGNATITRYSIYQWERANNAIPAAGTPSAGTPTSADERRLAYIAIFNCSGGTVPEGFLKTFMLEPAQGASQKTGYVEVLGLATSKTDPTAIHEEVQLYR
jgi:hypothetical protein